MQGLIVRKLTHEKPTKPLFLPRHFNPFVIASEAWQSRRRIIALKPWRRDCFTRSSFADMVFIVGYPGGTEAANTCVTLPLIRYLHNIVTHI
jgi:hypothetical protein